MADHECGLCGYTATSTADEGTAYCIVCELRGKLADVRGELDAERERGNTHAIDADRYREASRRLIGAYMAGQTLAMHINALEDACGFTQQGQADHGR